MPKLFPHYALASKIGVKSIELDGKTVTEVLENATQKFQRDIRSESRHAMFVVNGVNINLLDGFNTKLNESDEIWMILPSAGG